jgi:uncharacterized membrane protein
MKWRISEKNIRRLFNISIILKGLHALLELVGGVAVLFVSKTLVVNLATTLTAHELSEDPHDIVANYTIHIASQFSVPFQHLAALYLISHGVVVGLLVVGLLMKRLWSYPITVTVLGIFIVYQTYQFFLNHSWWIFGVTAFDIIVVFLTLHEYRYIKSEHNSSDLQL